MELLAELEPVKEPEKLIERAKILADVYDWIDIPDSPLGIPTINSLLASCSLSMSVTDRIISHIRLIDLNRIAFNSIIKTLTLAPFKRIVFLRGDPPRKKATIIDDIEPEQALSYARKKIKDKEIGLLLSLNKRWSEISKRIKTQPDFTLILNIKNADRELLDKLKKESEKLNIKNYAYIVVETKKNSGLLQNTVNRSSIFTEYEVHENMDRFSGYVDGFLISVPGDFRYLVELGYKLPVRR